MNSDTSTFSGPLFLVGMPRSGTKLLRELLNGHPQIGIVEQETAFLPFLLKKWQGKTLSEADRQDIYQDLKATNFFWNQQRFHGRAMSNPPWQSLDDSYLIENLLEDVFRFYAPKKGDFIWGDKTPGYLRHIPLLKHHWPEAKFIHIIRDPRDLCLSVNRAWRKSRRMAVHRWAQSVEKARRDGKAMGENYIEILYERLLQSPEQELERLCRFLDLPFNQDMVELSKPSEDLGETKGKSEIVRQNAGKYRRRIPTNMLTRLEAIAYPQLKALGYPIEHAACPKPLSTPMRWALWFHDKCFAARFHILDKGLVAGLRYAFRLQRHSPW